VCVLYIDSRLIMFSSDFSHQVQVEIESNKTHPHQCSPVWNKVKNYNNSSNLSWHQSTKDVIFLFWCNAVSRVTSYSQLSGINSHFIHKYHTVYVFLVWNLGLKCLLLVTTPNQKKVGTFCKMQWKQEFVHSI